MSLPLEGVRVLEVAQYVAAPLCAAQLAELGAEVIKIEPPAGDAYRRVMPLAPGVGRHFLPLNRGKRSVVLDLKSGAGVQALAALLATADVVVHNAPPARAEAFGLAWERLHGLHPALVMGVVTSFGPEGPLAGLPAYDLVAQARSGLLTAHASVGDAVPVRAGGIPMADLTAGLLLSTGVLAALVRARAGGGGERVEVSLLAAALAVQIQDLVWLEGEALAAGSRTATEADLAARAGEIAEGLALNPYYRCYAAADGMIAVSCLNLEQRHALLGLYGLDDPSVEAPDLPPADADERARRRALTAEVERRIASAPAAAWLERLGRAGVPCGPVIVRESVHADAQVRASGLLQRVDQPGLGPLTMLDRVFRLGAGRAEELGPAPELGADTGAVLAEVGL